MRGVWRNALVLVALAGCGDIIGLSGYTDGFEGGTMPQDAGPPPDAGPCMGSFSCVTVPQGWSLMPYAWDQRPNCKVGTALDVEEGINAPAATCGCGCTTNAPSCTAGNVTISAGNTSMCDNLTKQNGTSAPSCNGLNPSFSTNNQNISVVGPAPSGGSCGATPTKNVPNIDFQHQGRVCKVDVPLGNCANGGTCVPNDTKPFANCVAQAGMQTCPPTFPEGHIVGSKIADTRDCSACTCTFQPGTCAGTTTFYTDTGCTQNATNITTNGQCQPVGNRFWRAYKYAPSNNASCTASMSNPTGSVTFGDAMTVCCAR